MTDSWNDAEHVDWYLRRMRTLEPRHDGERAMLEVLPAAPRNIVDLGCGDGRLIDLVLTARPSVLDVLGVDMSPEMTVRAERRFADDHRVRILLDDIAGVRLDDGSVDAVVSGFAIHHLEDHDKRTLFATVARWLRPGGAFANLDVVQSSSPSRHREFLDAIGRAENDPEDRLAPVDDQLGWMTAAGLSDVECIWRWRGFALMVGELAERAP